MTILYLAGLENQVYYPIALEVGVKYALVSFFNIDRKYFPYNKFKKVFLDSGAFTFHQQMKAGKFSVKPITYLTDYMNYLRKEISKNSRIEAYAEFDVGSVHNSKKNTEMKTRYRSIMESHGLSPLPVYHNHDGEDYWRKLCENYNYICLGSLGREKGMNSALKKYKYLLDIANEYNTKVHGFGITSPYILKKVNFYSADSSTWTYSFRLGLLPLFRKGGIENISKKDFMEKYGISDMNHKVMGRFSLTQWKLYQDYIEQYWRDKNGV